MPERYSRQMLFPPIGKEGQAKIQSKHVLIIGAGALGSGVSEVLTRAGVGIVTIVDRDYIEESNLQRQQLYTEQDVLDKLPKAIAAKKRLEAINHEVVIAAHVGDATVELLDHFSNEVDLIIDATDNFETRMAINDISQKKNIPWIYGGCVGSYGMSFTIIPGVTPCLHCLLKAIPIQGLTCDTGGIIGPTVQMVVAHQTAEALKILSENIDAVRNTFVSFDVWRNQYTQIKVSKIKDPHCHSCGENRTYPYLNDENRMKTSVLCGRDTVQIRPPKERKLEFESLAKHLKSLGYSVKGNPYLLSLEKERQRLVIFQDGRALIHGTKNITEAKSLYQRILG